MISVVDRHNIVSERDIHNEGRKVTEHIRSKEAHPEAAKGSDRHTIGIPAVPRGVSRTSKKKER